MAFNIYTKGNMFYIHDDTNNILYEGLSKNVLVRRKLLISTSFSFTGVNNWDVSNEIAFADINLNNAPYTDIITFIDWYESELGKYSPQEGGNVKEIYKLSDLPIPESGVINLEPETAYKFYVSNLDLLGSRLVGGNNTSLLGSTSETSSITSTGLGVGVPLFTSTYTTPIQNITFNNVDTCFSIIGDSNTTALDWDKFNIINSPNIGLINGCTNWILTNSAFLNSKGLKFDGEIGTIGVLNSLLTGDGNTGSIIEVKSTANITRRFRPVLTSIVAFGDTVGIDFNDSATIPTEGYILDTVNFSGGGTYQTGVLSDSNKSLFVNCVGITNTAVNGQLYMRDNLTSTPITDTVNYFKVLGTTTASTDNAKYNHSDNRLTCKAIIERKYFITCTLSFTTSNNNICEFGFYDSKLGNIRQPSITKATANSAGRQEGVTFSCVVQHGFDDYLEIHARNTTGLNAITVTDMNFVILEIK